jgi:hypothetical protein
MRPSLRNDETWVTRTLSGLAAVALAVITIGTFVVVPALLETAGVDVRMPHVDEAAPRMSAAQYSD